MLSLSIKTIDLHDTPFGLRFRGAPQRRRSSSLSGWHKPGTSGHSPGPHTISIPSQGAIHPFAATSSHHAGLQYEGKTGGPTRVSVPGSRWPCQNPKKDCPTMQKNEHVPPASRLCVLLLLLTVRKELADSNRADNRTQNCCWRARPVRTIHSNGGTSRAKAHTIPFTSTP